MNFNLLKDSFFAILLILFVSCTQKVEKSNLNDSENTDFSSEYNVDFLNIKEGALAILDESYEPYFSKLQLIEIKALINKTPPSSNIEDARNYARDEFSSAVTSFSRKEKKAILFVIPIIKKILQENNLDIIANHPWKFIKIEDWLCGGFAHTRGDYIILSQKHLNHLTSDWNNKISKTDSISLLKNLGSLLVHEQFHSLQRQYPKKFESLYINSWGFEKAKVEIDSTILINQLTNPDAPKAEWVVNYDDTYFWVRTLIQPSDTLPTMGKDFVDVVFALDKVNDQFIIARDSSNEIKKQKLSDFKAYTNSFPVNQGLDHPNEITAYMFSKYFIATVEGKIPFENVSEKSKLFSQEYLNWLNNFF